MKHRHLADDVGVTPPAIGDIIFRGLWRDWVHLYNGARGTDASDVIERICITNINSPHGYPQRHQFWSNYLRFQRVPA